jgi:hypothetical protein
MPAGTVWAGILFADPGSGWDYTYEGTGDAFGTGAWGAFDALDGTWGHFQGDWWDGSAPRSGLPGGVDAVVDSNDGTEYLLLQDPGNPPAFGFEFEDEQGNSNRRLYFGHDMRSDNPGINQAVLDNGITISFRARLATDPPTLDDVYNEDLVPNTSPWPATGKGYEVYGGGRGHFGVIQLLGRDSPTQLSFSLIKFTEAEQFGLIDGGLTMNNLVDASTPLAVNTNDPGTKNVYAVLDANCSSITT